LTMDRQYTEDMKQNDPDVQVISRSIAAKKSSGFSGDFIIHFHRGVPQQVETKEFMSLEDLRKEAR
jgi:hypothetical protein